MKKTYLLIACVLAAAILAVFLIRARNNPPDLTASNEADSAIRARIEEFGSKLKNVSLLMPPTSLRDEMQAQYGPYLAPELLLAWQENPSQALGRTTSSPWPDRINVAAVTKLEPTSYKVEGNVIEVTSANPTEPAAVYPVTFFVESREDVWMISKAEKGAYSELPKKVSFSGLFECLPHKNASGPQTTECALGIAVDQSDAHYALDLRLLSNQPVTFPTGTHVQVEGMLVPKDQLNSNAWEKYPIDGIIAASSLKKI